jgi:hypothetical protein
MHKPILAIIVFFLLVSNPLFSQDSIYIDSVVKHYNKAYRKNLRLLKNRNDSTLFITAYNRKTGELLGFQFLVSDEKSSDLLRAGQYSFHLYPDGLVLMRIITKSEDRSQSGYAKYLYKNGVIVAREEGKNIDKEYSFLFYKLEEFKKAALEHLRQNEKINE